MEELKLIGSEGKALILAGEDGTQYRLPLTDALTSAVRPTPHPVARTASGPGPREIQALLRSGMTVEQVAEQTGLPQDDVSRFEAPIAAELDYMIRSAQNVALRVPSEGSSDQGSSFGEIIRERLDARGVTETHWASWKEDTGWIIQLEFDSAGAHIDARWAFDHKRHRLWPANDDARSLSSEEPPLPARATRLRAVHGDSVDTVVPPVYDVERDEGALDTDAKDGPLATPLASVTPLKASRPPLPSESIDTTDLLETLRLRRGERQTPPAEPSDADESAPVTNDNPVTPSTPRTPQGAPALDFAVEGGAEATSAVDSPNGDADAAPKGAHRHSEDSRSRSTRATMPTWDEIVFGSRGTPDKR